VDDTFRVADLYSYNKYTPIISHCKIITVLLNISILITKLNLLSILVFSYSKSQNYSKSPIFVKFRNTYKVQILNYNMEISNNKVVQIHYTGKLTDGAVFDSSEGKDALEFIFGSGMIIPGLEEGLSGMSITDKKTIEVGFEKAYGPVQEQARQEVPKAQLPADIPLEVGMQLAAQGPQGQPMPVTVAEIKEETVVMDFNHPLAGKDLIFEVTVVDVRDATAEELSHGHTHTEGEPCETEDAEVKEILTEDKKEN
jgi:FKBP-type peptidyl-prolyl cis-trans isomerase 2